MLLVGNAAGLLTDQGLPKGLADAFSARARDAG
jgi:hypothetical protein